MKVLKANLLFILPDNFDGDINDAFEHWVLYKDFAQTTNEGEPEFRVTSEALVNNAAQGYRTVSEVAVWEENYGTWRRGYEPVVGSKIKGTIFVK